MSKTNAKATKMPEFIRQMIVSLKRKPQTIALIGMVIAFLVYTMNLTAVSNTTAKIQGVGMGFSGFCTMLFSILAFVCFLNAFPTRKKPNIPMVILMFVMFAIIIGSDMYYSNCIYEALTRPENPITLGKTTLYIAEAYNMLDQHVMCMGITIALIVLMPVYSKLLRKINTNVDVEDNGSMAAIELSE